MPDSISWLDLCMIAVLLVSAGIGLWRGLVFELLALAGWGVAWLVSQIFGPDLGRSLGLGQPGSAWQAVAGIGVSFLATLVVWTLLASLMRALIAASVLSGLDRVLGAWFGLVRGFILLLVVATLVTLTPLAQSPIWQSSVSAGWLGQVLRVLQPVLPEAVSRHMRP